MHPAKSSAQRSAEVAAATEGGFTATVMRAHWSGSGANERANPARGPLLDSHEG